MKQLNNDNIRNIAIIAHVDHGKTTLVDAMFRQSGTFRDNQETEDRLMDKMDLERERGITIAAKNCSVDWDGIKINILDTPGHADFGGEVERALSMVDGAILLVDASEGPLPQTRFVLSKALKAGLKIIVVINKIDRPDARCNEVLDEVYDLLIDLDADESQLEFPLFYAIGRDGIAGESFENPGKDLKSLFKAIVSDIPGPSYDDDEPFQMLVSDLSYSDYLGRLAVGKVINGSVHSKDSLVCINAEGKQQSLNVTKLQVYNGPGLAETDTVSPGDIVVLSGIEDVFIGDTICTRDNPKALPRITVDEPTVSMLFAPNSSPLLGKEGKFVQSNKIGERLQKETMLNVSMKVEQQMGGEGFIVKGRGEFQMVILIETMRREGFELSVGRPHVIFKKDENGKKLEPIEHLFVDCEELYTGVVTEKLSKRKGRMINFVSHENGRSRLEFSVPSRALIGYRDEFLTDTRGTGIMSSYISGYEEYRGDFPERHTGSLVADRSGECVPYAIFNLEPRGKMFVKPGDVVYEGMIVGEHSRENDLNVNPVKTKKLSNMRASGKDDAVTLTPIIPLTIEKSIQYIKEDEMVEVTPKSIRLRKKILTAMDRKIAAKK
ncbi:MAG: translational GTPase TypA [Spirochaetales bacterium]|nr:translational GTPase TypA [Spirochaetales bacterium]